MSEAAPKIDRHKVLEHRRLCGAKTRTGKPCRGLAIQPSGRCRMHGGASPRGVAAGAFKHGRYSGELPARLIGKYQEAQADPEILAMRDDIALTDARLADVLGRVDTGESGSLWAAAVKALDKFLELESKGSDGAGLALTELRSTLAKGRDDYAAWDEVGKLIEQRRRLVESERKRLVDMQQVITTERAMLLISAIGDVIRTHVSDRSVLSAISEDVGKLIGSRAPTDAKPAA